MFNLLVLILFYLNFNLISFKILQASSLHNLSFTTHFSLIIYFFTCKLSSIHHKLMERQNFNYSSK